MTKLSIKVNNFFFNGTVEFLKNMNDSNFNKYKINK